MTAMLFFLVMAATPAVAQSKDTCIDCHKNMPEQLQTPALAFPNDVHAKAGFGCADCHGGDRTSEDPEVSMSKARGFRGKITRTAVPEHCARCHSDATIIHRFRPQQRVDQLAQYRTSVHGKRLAAGDTKVANCVDCHSVHNIRDVKDPLAPVHPERLPDTCARCHADSAQMAQYKLPVTIVADYHTSVHWEALAKRRDFSAPSCATCHGNHGATPPAAASVPAVCGSCHALVEGLYAKSPHQPAFAALGVAGCVACHNNHAVQRTSEALLGGPQAICANCHDANSAGGRVAAGMFQRIQSLDQALRRAEEILGRARRAGMEVSEALVSLQEGKERLIKTRVAVHNFRLDAVDAPVKEGLAIAAQGYRAGEEALAEQRFRRLGLGVSLLTILITLAGLWVAIRAIEEKATNEGARQGPQQKPGSPNP